MIGQSKTNSMKAAKILDVCKSVYRVGNTDVCYTDADLRNHIEGLNIRVISCYERTSVNPRISDNKSFRVCVVDADKDKFLIEENWAVGISIQRWIFKPEKDVEHSNCEAGAPDPKRARADADTAAKEGGVSTLAPDNMDCISGELSSEVDHNYYG
jgi:hypothetical protein